MGWNPLTGFLNINKILTIPLVLGAELKCSCGSKHSFLLLEKADIDINCLPKACVDDSKALINIRPFGNCSDGSSCKECMELEEEWENPEPQNEFVNRKEIITTKSFLLCRAKGGTIEAETSGQEHDKSFIEVLMLFAEMEEKYEGLFDLLLDPYGSLYLEDGMYEKAIQFLADYLEEKGGEVFLPGIYDMKDPKDVLVVAVLDRLLTDCDCSSYDRLINGLENIGAQLGMDQVGGWDVHKLNNDMIEMLRADCMATAEKINTSSFARWTEEHKKFVSIMGDAVLNLAYAVMIWHCTTAGTAAKKVTSTGGADCKTIPQQLTRDGQVPTIGKMKDLNIPGNVVEGEFKVADYLPDMGNPQDNWHQNSGILRSVMNEGVPIKDVSMFPMDNAGFLGAERNLLKSRGWTYIGGFWYPP